MKFDHGLGPRNKFDGGNGRHSTRKNSIDTSRISTNFSNLLSPACEYAAKLYLRPA